MLDLKMVFSDFYGQSLIYELILALVSLWLLVNSFKETSKEKRLIDFFDYFIQRYFDYFIIIFSRYFDYFIIIIFLFNRGYGMNDELDFVLMVLSKITTQMIG